MGQFLNNKEPYDKYRMVMNGTYFVDKSEILEELIPALQQEQRFFCITRPRRFGKTIMANMIAAFFENTGENSLFDNLHISEYDQYKKEAGKHDVIYIDFSEMPRECNSYRAYIDRIQEGLIRDIEEAYPEINVETNTAVWDILRKHPEAIRKDRNLAARSFTAMRHLTSRAIRGMDRMLTHSRIIPRICRKHLPCRSTVRHR